MPLHALTDPSAVFEAIAEFDRLGQRAFLEKYGYGRAQQFVVIHDGKRYDSKALAGAAHGYQFPTIGPLRSDEFSGGELTVKAKLKALGFVVGSQETQETHHQLVIQQRPDQGIAWAEVTTLEHGHGGLGWELGRCLWSPSTSKDGANRYEVMRSPNPGDLVFHLVAGVLDAAPKQRFLYGISRVGRRAVIVEAEPPAPGIWKGAGSYFRIELTNYQELHPKHAMDALEAGLEELILADLVARPKYYPYSPYRQGFRGSQGLYLAKLSSSLAAAFHELMANGSANEPISSMEDTHSAALEFAEGERARREQSFFKRNPALRAAAVKQYGLRCVACAINFEETYGALGEGYIEIHHLNPLAERADTAGETLTTTLEDVVPLCANCHRMVHRRRPALSIQELRSTLRIR